MAITQRDFKYEIKIKEFFFGIKKFIFLVDYANFKIWNFITTEREIK